MRLLKACGGLALLLLAGYSSAQANLSVTEAFACDSTGAPRMAKVGEPFWVGTRFRVTGQLNSYFKYRIETPYSKLDSSRLSFGTQPGDYFVFWGPIPTLMDGPIDVRVTLDPEHKLRGESRLDNVARFTVTPLPPSEALEYFAPRSWASRFGTQVDFQAGSARPRSLSAWMPIPIAEGFQSSVSTMPVSYSSIESDPFGQPIGVVTLAPTNLDPVVFEASFQTVAQSVRTSFELLKLQGNHMDPEQAVWLQAEKMIEVGRPEFSAWVSSVFPSGRQGLSTAEVARELYKSVLKRTSYQFRAGAMPSALKTLREKKGDCGALSSLYVALCRTAGIPARTVAGFAKGSNNWHVWAEFHVGGAGWIPVDPSYAEYRLPNGSDLPIYFGVIPELNERVATAYGFDRRAAGIELPMLQSPAVFWTGPNVRVQRVSVFCRLAEG